jgi:hypothetical protein
MPHLPIQIGSVPELPGTPSILGCGRDLTQPLNLIRGTMIL